MQKYIIQTAQAKMPASCRGSQDYYRIAVLELDGSGIEPKFIGQRARGVSRVVETWERLYRGSTTKCAFEIAMIEAEALCDELNTNV